MYKNRSQNDRNVVCIKIYHKTTEMLNVLIFPVLPNIPLYILFRFMSLEYLTLLLPAEVLYVMELAVVSSVLLMFVVLLCVV